MSLGSGPMSPKRWRPWEQIGWAAGVAAGAIAPLCLWDVHHRLADHDGCAPREAEAPIAVTAGGPGAASVARPTKALRRDGRAG